MRFTFDITCLLVLGVDPCSLALDFPTVPLVIAFEEAEEAIFMRHLVPMFWWKLKRALGIGMEKRLAMASKVVDSFIAQCIAEKREEVCRRVQTASDLLSQYLKLEADDHNNIESSLIGYFRSDEFLRDTLLTLLTAGRDTTGSALSWLFHSLLMNPDAEKKIFKELCEVRSTSCEGQSSSWTVFEAEEIEGMVYLHAALCESMRLFPPVPLNHKSASKQDMLSSGHRVEPCTMIIYSSYSAARMEGVWGKDCLEFKPERWISNEGKLKHEPSYKFLAFHSGPRACLGKNVAFTQMKVAAAAIIYNFHIEAVKDFIVEPTVSITLQMKHGLLVNVRKRGEKNDYLELCT